MRDVLAYGSISGVGSRAGPEHGDLDYGFATAPDARGSRDFRPPPKSRRKFLGGLFQIKGLFGKNRRDSGGLLSNPS